MLWFDHNLFNEWFEFEDPFIFSVYRTHILSELVVIFETLEDFFGFKIFSRWLFQLEARKTAHLKNISHAPLHHLINKKFFTMYEIVVLIQIDWQKGQ